MLRENAKEVLMPRNGEDFIFPFADESVKLAGRDQALRTPTSIREHVARGEERNDVLMGESDGSSDGSHPLDQQTSSFEARNDFWSISWNHIHRHHVEPRVKHHVTMDWSFPVPLQYNVVTRTNTTLDVYLESRFDIYWNVDGRWDVYRTMDGPFSPSSQD